MRWTLQLLLTLYVTENRGVNALHLFTILMHEFIYCGTTVTTMDVIVLFFYWIVMQFINYCQKLQLVVAVCEMRERKKHCSLLEFYWIDISWRYRCCALLSIVLIYCVYFICDIKNCMSIMDGVYALYELWAISQFDVKHSGFWILYTHWHTRTQT